MELSIGELEQLKTAVISKIASTTRVLNGLMEDIEAEHTDKVIDILKYTTELTNSSILLQKINNTLELNKISEKPDAE